MTESVVGEDRGGIYISLRYLVVINNKMYIICFVV